MQSRRNPYHLLNSFFVLGILLLFVNDHYLKFRFANWLTGKLSDAAGIVILPLLMTYLLPFLRRWSVPMSAVLFAFWKSPLSQPIIDVYNGYTFIPITRVVDYSDLFVFVLLPIPYFLLSRIDRLPSIQIHRLHPLLVLLPTLFILMATSQPPSAYLYQSNGNVKCYKCVFTVNENQETIIEKLGRHRIVFDSIAPFSQLALASMPRLKKENAHFYRLNRLIIGRDTLRNLDFAMRTFRNHQTRIYFNGMQVADEVADTLSIDQIREHYQALVIKELKHRLE